MLKKELNMESKYKEIWKSALEKKEEPKYFTGIEEIYYEDFKLFRDDFNQKRAENLVEIFLTGKILIIKNAFNQNFVERLKKNVKNFWKNNPDTFHKMVEGCPDFHRVITPKLAENYAFGAVRHMTYFFPWNNDPCKINEEIYERWRYCKYVSGLKFDEFEKNTPKDGPVDRIQIGVYPPEAGGIERHFDPVANHPLIACGYLSSRKNKDFSNGGLFFIDKNNKKVDVEKFIDVGDLSLFYGTIEHGVNSIVMHEKISFENYDWHSGLGRWWMGLFTADSDMMQKRNTTVSLEKYHSKKFKS